MSEESSADGPDFRQGVLLDRVADGQMLLGHVAGEPALLVRRAEGCLRSARRALTMAGRWSRGSWLAIPCAAPGITRASACAQARPCGHRR